MYDKMDDKEYEEFIKQFPPTEYEISLPLPIYSKLDGRAKFTITQEHASLDCPIYIFCDCGECLGIEQMEDHCCCHFLGECFTDIPDSKENCGLLICEHTSQYYELHPNETQGLVLDRR